ncbi:hypothetical protein MMC21_006669 [Puttea exsequens]|nr:hypothetical protein [Puttea exsequens]
MEDGSTFSELILALQDLASLLIVWASLAASKGSCYNLKSLIAEHTLDLGTAQWLTSTKVTIQHLEQTATLREQCLALGGDGTILTSMNRLIGSVVADKIELYLTKSDTPNRHRHAKADLAQLQDIEQ